MHSGKKIWASLVLFISLQHLLQAQENTATWFPFQPKENFAPSVIDMSSWLDAPAGKHGVVEQKGSDFVFADGTPVKFWGVNIASGWPFVEKEEASRWAQYLAKYGVNSVRFHKFTGPGLTGHVSTQLDENKLKNLDFFSNQLKQNGIYYGWSHIYGHKPRPGDKERLLAYDEVMNAGSGHLKSSTIGLVNFAPDLQDLSIELTVNMLNHRNPYTGMRYADDPALHSIELQNEDNIFFATTHNWVMAAPTYKKLFQEQFSDWLKAKYGSHEKLIRAWGAGAIDAWPEFQKDEHLDKRNIYPLAHHGYLGKKALSDKRTQKRLYDTALFLYETQNKFYERYVKAIRDTGYKGTILASCWQAGDDIAHYYNLHSDYLFGYIDRHNYYGGGIGGHQLAPGKYESTSMLAAPGSGLLSTGLQAVADRPFVLSEWMAMLPNEWTAESAPIIAAYGMGLQGWDASYVYASNEAGMTTVVQAPRHGVYNADNPLQMGLYPALARMIYRGDVQEGGPVSVRNVYVPDLAKGHLGFNQNISQNQDVKIFEGDVPAATLAAGKAVVAFPNQPTETVPADLSKYWNKATNTITSNTGQLQWHYGQDKGYFTINTPGTKGVVGFSEGKAHKLGDVTITTETSFSVVLLTSLEPDKTIGQAKRLLVTTVARARNTGMRYAADEPELIAVGETPVLLEPVKTELHLQNVRKGKVNILDHAGRRTGESFRFRKNTVLLDGARHQALYYEIEFKD